MGTLASLIVIGLIGFIAYRVYQLNNFAHQIGTPSNTMQILQGIATTPINAPSGLNYPQ